MKTRIASALLVAMLLTAVPAFSQISFGLRIGPPPVPRVLRVIPRQPSPEYVWIEGYWYPARNGRSYQWHAGYWTRAPYAGARWIAPRHDGQMYFEGYWDSDRGRELHNHASDRNRDRDYRR